MIAPPQGTSSWARRVVVGGVAGVIALVIGAYIALVIVPFVHHDLIWQAERIRTGLADPRYFAPFTWDRYGFRLWFVGAFLAFYGPFVLLLLAGVFCLVVRWDVLTHRARCAANAVLIVAGICVVWMLSPFGQWIAMWLMD